MTDQLDAGVYYDGVGDRMTDDEVREMLRVHFLDGWYAMYESVDVVLHRDGGVTIEVSLKDDHVRGLAETW